MSYKANKPGLVSVLYLSMRYNYGIVVYWGPFLCIVSFHCYVCCLISLTVLGASVTNLNEPPRALAIPPL